MGREVVEGRARVGRSSCNLGVELRARHTVGAELGRYSRKDSYNRGQD